MVLELKVPHGDNFALLGSLLQILLRYVLSFEYLAIYWTNHHDMLHATHWVTGAIQRANLHLLFWLSPFPFVTGWIGENHFAPAPLALYGIVLLMAAIAYWILQCAIIVSQGQDSLLARSVVTSRGRYHPCCMAWRLGCPLSRPGLQVESMSSLRSCG